MVSIRIPVIVTRLGQIRRAYFPSLQELELDLEEVERQIVNGLHEYAVYSNKTSREDARRKWLLMHDFLPRRFARMQKLRKKLRKLPFEETVLEKMGWPHT